MKKIFFILLVLFTGSSFVAEASNETSCMNSSVEGRRWTVTITVNMIYEYYENEIRTIFVGSVNKGTTTERVSVYAECVPHQEIIKERPTTKVKNAMYGWFDR